MQTYGEKTKKKIIEHLIDFCIMMVRKPENYLEFERIFPLLGVNYGRRFHTLSKDIGFQLYMDIKKIDMIINMVEHIRPLIMGECYGDAFAYLIGSKQEDKLSGLVIFDRKTLPVAIESFNKIITIKSKNIVIRMRLNIF